MSKSNLPSKRELLDELKFLRSRVSELEAEIQRLHPTTLKASGPVEQSSNKTFSKEESLAEANKMEAVGHLAGGVAHNFNNMLTVIMNYTRMILQQIDPQHSFYSQLKGIEKASDRCAVLTSQLLAFGRRQFLVSKEININNLILKLNRQLHELSGNHISLAIQLDESLTNVKADPDKLEQALLTLMNYSRGYLQEDGALKIETKSTTIDETSSGPQESIETKGYALIVITDNGPGLDQNTLDHLFEPFYKAGVIGEHNKGLEMASVYGIVKQSGGHIEVESALGKGTTFKLYFPLVESSKEESPRAETQLTDVTILLVDDEDQVREVVEALLTSLGYKTLTASDGQSALKLFENYTDSIHLLLTDVLMPNMNGIELARNLQTLQPDLHTLFMSGNIQEVYEHNDKESEIVFLAKPFSPEELQEKIKEALTTPPF